MMIDPSIGRREGGLAPGRDRARRLVLPVVFAVTGQIGYDFWFISHNSDGVKSNLDRPVEGVGEGGGDDRSRKISATGLVAPKRKSLAHCNKTRMGCSGSNNLSAD
jgi:hypothetical protein